MALIWRLADARTGLVRAEVPRTVADRPLAVTMGAYESLSVSVPYPASTVSYANTKAGSQISALAALADWKAGTRPGASNLIAIDETGNPCWGGLILTRHRDASAGARLDCVTLEAYLARRYVGAFTRTGIDQNSVFADLITAFIKDGTLPGLPIRVVWTASTQTQTVALAANQDTTVAQVAERLASVPGGIRWTIGWEYQHSPERITPVLYVGDRLGSAKLAGQTSPNAMFSMPGNTTDFTVTEDYSSGPSGGANIVTMTGPGQTDTRDAYTATAADYLGRPAYEYRTSPATSTGSIQLTMAQYALGGLAILQNGSKVVSIKARVAKAPRFGVDFGIGSDVGYDLMAPGVIDGELSNGIGQCVGWQRDDATLTQTPVLLVPAAS